MITLDALRAYGANVEDGLRRCMNMEAFYLKLFDRLKGDSRPRELKAAIERKDLDAAFELAHAMKGVYANLSLTPLLRPTEEITELLRARTDTDYSALLEEILARAEELEALFLQTGHKRAFSPKEAGIRIRDARKAAGLSQKELATILRVPVNRVSLMELGNVTEKETETILRRIAGKPAREIMNHKVKPTEQVLLGSNIRDARNAARLSQKELGDLLQLPQTKISLIERGKVDEPTGRRILQMLNAMVENKSSDMEMARQDVVPLGRERHRSMRAPDPELGKAVHDARVAAGLNQKELARMMGMSQGSISYMEQGKTDQEQANRALALIAQAAGTANPAESSQAAGTANPAESAEKPEI